MLLGYSTYFTTMIRSNADPGRRHVQRRQPGQPGGYLSRDQYGDWPLLYMVPIIPIRPRTSDGSDLCERKRHEYELAGKSVVQDWGNTPSAHSSPGCGTAVTNARRSIPIRNFPARRKEMTRRWRTISNISKLPDRLDVHPLFYVELFRANRTIWKASAMYATATGSPVSPSSTTPG
jgi:hypothetical protein